MTRMVNSVTNDFTCSLAGTLIYGLSTELVVTSLILFVIRLKVEICMNNFLEHYGENSCFAVGAARLIRHSLSRSKR